MSIGEMSIDEKINDLRGSAFLRMAHRRHRVVLYKKIHVFTVLPKYKIQDHINISSAK